MSEEGLKSQREGKEGEKGEEGRKRFFIFMLKEIADVDNIE